MKWLNVVYRSFKVAHNNYMYATVSNNLIISILTAKFLNIFLSEFGSQVIISPHIWPC